jgi:hypothetical protein
MAGFWNRSLRDMLKGKMPRVFREVSLLFGVGVFRFRKSIESFFNHKCGCHRLLLLIIGLFVPQDGVGPALGESDAEDGEVAFE